MDEVLFWLRGLRGLVCGLDSRATRTVRPKAPMSSAELLCDGGRRWNLFGTAEATTLSRGLAVLAAATLSCRTLGGGLDSSGDEAHMLLVVVSFCGL